MYTLDVTDVNEAYVCGLQLILTEGKRQESRAGDVIALQHPLSVTYQNPLRRVLFDEKRDANPFFHLFESLWLLAGRNDARWLDRFVSDFSSRFAEEDGTLHGSYGYRWRNHFDMDGGGLKTTPDQLSTVVDLLKANPDDRRVVIQMWDCVADLGQPRKDVPCNTVAIPRVRFEGENREGAVLDLTVFNRSNDFIWGLTGANAVQFSILLEYLAGRIGIAPGTYTQISTNAHVYADHLTKVGEPAALWATPGTTPMGDDWDNWDTDLEDFFAWTLHAEYAPPVFYNIWFECTAVPMFQAHGLWKERKREEALNSIFKSSIAPDWRTAAYQWMYRRIARAGTGVAV